VARLAVLRDGLELPYVERGDPDGVAVVLLHGWVDSRRCFERVMAVLPERVHAFAFDQRGHGDAPKPWGGYELRDFADDVGAFMDAVGLDAAVLAGASSGGYMAQRFAVDNPGRPLGLALVGSPRSLRGRGRLSPTSWPGSRTRSMRPSPVSSARGWSRVRFPER
jgi:pimeloyl-ACP methyl ester carboxylesterase